MSPLQRRSVTAGLMIATAIQVADALIANVALPQLQSDLEGGIELGAWVITSYLCATAVMAPLTGWLRRRYGAARLFPAAVGGFVAASLLCAIAPSAPIMIVFRILQGAGAGIIAPLAQAILLDIHPPERHGRVMAQWGAALMVGPILGPLLGGIITDLASWRWVFAINLPLGLLVILLMRGLASRADLAADTSIDVTSVLLLTIAVGALELTLERSVGRRWFQSPELASEAGVTIISLVLLGIRSSRTGFSIFRPDVFKDLNFAAAAFYNFMASGLLFVAVVFLPALAQGPLSFSATLGGLTIVPRAILMTLTMLVVGRLIGQVSYRILLGSGWVLMAAGLAMLAHIEPTEALLWMFAGSIVQAIGAGLLFPPHSTLAFSTLTAAQRTDAAGIYSLVRQLGFASGVALMSAVLRTKIDANLLTLGTDASVAGSTEQLANAAALGAYAGCFEMMAVAAIAVSPGILVFRARGPFKEASAFAPSAKVDSAHVVTARRWNKLTSLSPAGTTRTRRSLWTRMRSINGR